MDDQVMGDAEGGDQQDQHGKEDRISIHPPVVQEEDEGEKDVQYGNVECQTTNTV